MTFPPKKPFDFYRLEDRVLLSGESIEVDAVDAGAEAAADAFEMQMADAALLPRAYANANVASDASQPHVDETADTTTESSDQVNVAAATWLDVDGQMLDATGPLELIFVDAGVEDAQQLIDDRRDASSSQWLVIEIAADEDGIERITQTLAELDGIDAVHLLSHGDGDGIQLGNTKLTAESAGGYAGDLASWADALDDDADLLIYGCDLASTDDGQDLLAMLAAVCDCDVAASDDLTGHADLGGDWLLEYTVGDVETDTAFGYATQASWYSTLDITSNLVGHYEFETSPGSYADSTGNQDATTNAGIDVNNAAVGDRSLFLALDPSGNAFIEVADNTAQDFGSGDFTVNFWYQYNGTAGTEMHLIGDHDGQVGSAGFRIYIDSSGDLRFQRDSGSNSATVGLGAAVMDGSWQMVTVMQDGSNVRYTTNAGNLSTLGSAALNVNTSNTLRIGASSSTTGDFDGNIDDVRLYTRSLSSSDIDELYALGALGQPDGYSFPGGGDNSVEWITNVTFDDINHSTGQETNAYGNYTAQSTDVAIGESNTLSVTIVDDDNNNVYAWVDWNQDGDFEDADETFVVATGVTTPGPHSVNIVTPGHALAGSTVMRIGMEWNATPTPDGSNYGEYEDYTVAVQAAGPDMNSGLVLHHSFDTDASDSTANNYDGTLAGGASINNATGTNQIGGGKVEFDGIDDAVDFSAHAADLDDLAEGTLAFWFYSDAWSGEETLFHAAGSGGEQSLFSIGGYGGDLFAYAYDSAGVEQFYADFDTNILAQTWTHVAFTMSTSGNRVYVNGVEQSGTYWSGSSSTDFFLADLQNTDSFSWGASSDGGSGFQYGLGGFMDDARIYDRALSATDIAELYTYRDAGSPAVQHSGRFLFTTNGDVTGAGTPGITDWENAEVLELTSPTFEPGGTGGSLASAIDFNTLVTDGDGDIQVNAMHIVSMDVTVGGTNLLRGDVVFSSAQDETISGINVQDEDVMVFRPTTVGDWSSGSFFLLADMSDIGQLSDTQALTIAEVDMTVGGTNVNAGDLVVAFDGEDLTHVVLTVAGTNTAGSTSLFLDGSDLDIEIDNRIVGAHLVSHAVDVGDSSLTVGQMLVTLTTGDGIDGLVAVDPQDVFILDVTATGSSTGGSATAWFDGSDLGMNFSDDDEEIHSV
ncbi:MAG: DUF4347 domain-containing protein, partial [Planctomycetota bacterium]